MKKKNKRRNKRRKENVRKIKLWFNETKTTHWKLKSINQQNHCFDFTNSHLSCDSDTFLVDHAKSFLRKKIKNNSKRKKK